MKPIVASLLNAGFYFAGLMFLLFFTFAAIIDKSGAERSPFSLGAAIDADNWLLVSFLASAAVGIPLGFLNGVTLLWFSKTVRTALLAAAVSGVLLAAAIVIYISGRMSGAAASFAEMVIVTLLIGGVFFSVFALCNVATIRLKPEQR